MEATEESVSYALNYAADKIAGDPEAQFTLRELAGNALGGAVSGGILSGGATAVNRARNLPKMPLPLPRANEKDLTLADVVHQSLSGNRVREESGLNKGDQPILNAPESAPGRTSKNASLNLPKSSSVTQVLDAEKTAPSSQSSETPLASPESALNQSVAQTAGESKALPQDIQNEIVGVQYMLDR